MDTTATSSANIFTHLKSLHQKGLFRQELATAESVWGPYIAWHQPKQLIVGGNIFSNLGLSRIAAAMRLWAWRKDKSNPEAIYAYILAIYTRKGPLRALGLFEKFGDLPQANAHLKGKYLALKASVYAQYRDWETAHQLLDQAKALSPKHPFITMEFAYLYEAEDQYEKAAEISMPLAQQGFRQAVQFAAYLRTLADDQEGAIKILEPYVGGMESISICLQLYRIYQQSKLLVKAEGCLQRAKELLPEGKDIFSQEFSCAAYELAYLQKDYDKAKALLKTIKAPYFKKISESLALADFTKSIVKLDVPFVRQHHMTCAPATLTAIAKYWQQPADHLGIVEDICYDGTPYQAERQWAVDQGWVVKEFDLAPHVAMSLIDRGVPFTLSTVSPGSAHLQALVGYDPIQGLYLVRDPYYPSIQEFLIHDFGLQAASYGPRCMALLPKDKAELLEGIDFPAGKLYDLNFELLNALMQHNKSQAVVCLARLKQVDPDHRLTLQATRTLARYDGDQLSELEILEQLENRYPEDLNIKAEKAALLGRIGRYDQQIAYLKMQVNQADPNPYIVEALANCLRHDRRESNATRRLLNYVLYRQPTNAFALWMYAGILWDQEDYTKAFEYYRLCACLEDKNEGYIGSYFKAARFLKRQDKALADLKGRVERLGRKSFYPFESLYFAYRALCLDDAALKTMQDAYGFHHQEGICVRRLIEIYLYNGMADNAQKILNEGSHYLSIVDRLELSARIASYKNDWRKEKAYYEELLEHHSLRSSTIHALASLLAHHEDEEVAVKFIESRLALNPNDLGLLFLKLEWLFKRDIQDQEIFARHIITLHENDADARIKLANILADQALNVSNSVGDEKSTSLRKEKMSEALEQATTAYSINPLAVDSVIALGDLYRRNDELEKAKQYYQEAICLSADVEGGFPRLLRCEESMSRKRELLGFIYEQLMKQTSYGNGILEYADVARDLIKDEELLSFLEEAVRLRPDLWQSWAALGMHLGVVDKVSQALEVMSKAIAQFPFTPRLLLERARLYYMAQDFVSAEKDLQSTLVISPQWIRAITLLADVYESQNRIDAALSLIESALNHSPKSAPLHGYIADLHATHGDYEKSLQHLEKALSLDPYYEWAWGRHREISYKTNSPDATLLLLDVLKKQYPNNGYIWKVIAEHEKDSQKQLLAIEKAIEIYPKSEDYNLVKCRILFSENRLSELNDFIHHDKWGGFPPAALLAYEAWIEAKYQRFDKAIDKMQGVVDTFPYYYDGWRLLARWQQQTGNYAQSVGTVRHCVRLSPHNSNALTLAAETLIEANHHDVEVNAQEIGHWLKKAVVFNPKDQYSGLTWLDYLIETKNVEELNNAKDVLLFDERNPYYQVRVLQTALLQKDEQKALEIFKSLLVIEDKNEWFFDTSYTSLSEYGLKQALVEVLQEAIELEKANPMVGRLWLRIAYDNKESPKNIFKYLDQLESHDSLWHQAMEIVFKPTNYGKVTNKIVRRFRQKLEGDGRLWSLVTYYYASNQNWRKARRWCASNWRREGNDAWAVYLYGFGLRLIDKWRDAGVVNQFARSLPEDDYADRILLWHLVDGAINHAEDIHIDSIGRIRVPELSALESYVYDLLQAMWLAQKNGLQPAAKEISEVLQAAKVNHQRVLQDQISHRVKRRVKYFLYRYIQGGFWQKLLWRFKLFNMM